MLHDAEPAFSGELRDSNPFHLYGIARSTAQSRDNAEEYNRKVHAFNQKRPWGNRFNQSRVSSWSDPVSAREILNEGENSDDATEEEDESVESHAIQKDTRNRTRSGSQLARKNILDDGDGDVMDSPEGEYVRDDSLPPLRRRPKGTGFGARRWDSVVHTVVIMLISVEGDGAFMIYHLLGIWRFSLPKE